MNIYEFISEFNDIIPYEVSVCVGNNDKNNKVDGKLNKSLNNLRGTGYFFCTQKNGETVTTLKPATDLSLPIKIKVICSDASQIIFNRPSGKGTRRRDMIRYTNKIETHHCVRIIGQHDNQIGSIDLTLNPSGDVLNQVSTYSNKDNTHQIIHHINYGLDRNENIIKNEHITYIKKDIDNHKTIEVEIYQTNNMINNILVKNKGQLNVETKESSVITSLNNKDISYFFSRCYYNTDSGIFNNQFTMNLDSNVIQNDLLYYQQQKRSIEELKTDGKYPLWISPSLVNYVENENNDLLKGFVGEYIGHTLVGTSQSLILWIHTKENDINYYTNIDLTDTNPIVGTDLYEIAKDRDPKYFERIKQAPKIPKFVTRTIDGKECLIDYLNFKADSQLFQEFQEFKNIYMGSSNNITGIQMNKILVKK